jgi:DNA-directed RNA polymerase subunit RPC12/RpoP
MKIFSRQIDKVEKRLRKMAERKPPIRTQIIPTEKVKDSIGDLRPDMLKQWSDNNIFDPFTLTLFSHRRVLWICTDCNKEFLMEVNNIARKKNIRCSKCKDREPTDENRLSIVCPNLVFEWHKTKNGNLKPEDISYGKQIDIWWQCLDCNHEWKSRLVDRSIQGKGCPICSKLQSKGVKAITKYLKDNNFEYEVEKSFPKCKYKQHLRFDFYLEKYNLLIEYNGKQHYESIDFFGGEPALKDIQIRDEIKRRFCVSSNKRLLEIPYWEEKNIGKILSEILTN